LAPLVFCHSAPGPVAVTCERFHTVRGGNLQLQRPVAGAIPMLT
jgi:hypothetical protein